MSDKREQDDRQYYAAYSMAELAELKGVKHATVRQAIDAGHLKVRYSLGGGTRLVLKSSADAWHPTPGVTGPKPKK